MIHIWGVNSNDDIFKCKKPCTGGWELVPGKLKQIDGGYDYVYGVNSNNDIFTLPVGAGSKSRCDATINGLFGVNSANNIWRSALGLQFT
ncbi:hypothetical protein EMCRGX_G033447 [Ephydatia muelleri]|eukprot:Em0022g785a